MPVSIKMSKHLSIKSEQEVKEKCERLKFTSLIERSDEDGYSSPRVVNKNMLPTPISERHLSESSWLR